MAKRRCAAEPLKGYFNETDQTLDVNADARCLGLDTNTGGPTNIIDPFNDEQDPFNGLNLRFPTEPDPALRCEMSPSFFSEGDRLPLDWLDDHREDILSRLAPNTASNPLAVPDFRSSRYFQDLPGGSGSLELVNLLERPLIAFSRTPLGRATKNIRQWWQGCSGFGNACPSDPSWAKIAAGDVPGCEGDPEWDCRKHYLLIVTDGADNCNKAPFDPLQPDFGNTNDACANVADLLKPRAVPSNSSIETFVISFGRGDVPPDQLKCMAREGSPDGDGTPFTARDREELINRLKEVLARIREERTAFATAAVPSVQAEAGERLFITQFVPLSPSTRWQHPSDGDRQSQRRRHEQGEHRCGKGTSTTHGVRSKNPSRLCLRPRTSHRSLLVGHNQPWRPTRLGSRA